MKTKTELKHTPLPWRVGKSDSKLAGIPNLFIKPPAIQDQHGNYLAVFGGGNVHFQDAEANADFTARAVNSHGALMSLAKDYLDHLMDENDQVGVINRIRDIIVKAEGK